MQYLLLSVWLNFLSVKPYRFIYGVTKGSISFFLKLNNLSITFSVSIYPLIETYVISIHWLL